MSKKSSKLTKKSANAKQNTAATLTDAEIKQHHAQMELGELSRLKLVAHNEAQANEQLQAFVGKCFRYRNNFSCPDSPKDYWWMYAIVTEVKNGNCFGFQFERDKYGDLRIGYGMFASIGSSGSGYRAISQGHFQQAWKKEMAKVSKQYKDALALAK